MGWDLHVAFIRHDPAVAAIIGFQNIGDAGEAPLGQLSAVNAALSRPAGVHSFDHGGILCRHQAGRLDSETDNWAVRDGLMVIPKDTAIADGTVI